MINDNAPKIYGLDEIKKESPVYITEGPFDSSFIKNSIAMCGADADVYKWGVSDPVWIYDNEENEGVLSATMKLLNEYQTPSVKVIKS